MLFGLILFSIVPYAFSNWLVWQSMKQNTILPYGSKPGRYGQLIGWGIKFLFFGTVLTMSVNYGWVHLIAIPITWIISGWVATLIERRIYMNLVMNDIIGIAKMYADADYDFAIRMLGVPEWWFKLMPGSWQRDYVKIIENLNDE